ncbi:KRI1-like family protein [Nitzschia inconspicua]|uniref:KRI1-like family protein n=1 Tax=Nitzschia inconspicua TaxID=303405 RepID=A0A9K3PQI9_9STRA|nr:KRI1-like family protein [Nitzschia inconspicua]
MTAPSSKKKNLFDDDDHNMKKKNDESSSTDDDSSASSSSTSSSSSSTSSDDTNSKPNDSWNLTVNKKYATEYQNRKEREELRQIQQQRAAQGIDDNDDDDDAESSSDEEEDEHGALLTPSVNVQFLKTIKALRQKSDIIYDPNQRFFDEDNNESDDDDDDDDDDKAKSSHKPKRFKDVIREQILEQMDSDDDEKQEKDKALALSTTTNDNSRSKLAYNEQQDELRKAFLQESAKLDGDGHEDNKESKNQQEDDGWMLLKKKTTTTTNKHGINGKEAAAMELEVNKELKELEQVLSKQQKESKDRDSTFQDPRGEIQDGEQFLYDFIKNKKWIDKNDDIENDSSREDSNDDNDEDSLDEIEKADEFESNYNFRFEQAAAETGASGAMLSVKTYARGQTMNTLRRDDTARKEKRKARNERKAAERKAKEEQLKRLKNAKKKELDEKLSQVKSVIGAAQEDDIDEIAIMKMLEGDYDPEQFEKAMQAAYGDDFYQKEDPEWKSDLDVRKSLNEDDDGEVLVGQDDVDGGMYDTYDGKDDEEEEETGNADGNDEEWNEGDDEYYDASQQEETELEKKLKAKMQEELYKLDYEDIVAGMPTRFKYREVEPNDYGLTTQEILFARDSTLKQFVSLKKMAPYNENGEFHVGSKKRRKFREQLKQDLEEEMAQEEKSKEITKVENNMVEEGEEGKKKKRRRLKKGKKNGSDNLQTLATPKEAIPNTASPAEHSALVEHETNESSKKRRRKKSGTKGSAAPSEITDGPRESPPTIRGEEEASTQHPSKLDLSESVANKTKKKSKTGKKRKKLVDGVSKARLAAYGL